MSNNSQNNSQNNPQNNNSSGTCFTATAPEMRPRKDGDSLSWLCGTDYMKVSSSLIEWCFELVPKHPGMGRLHIVSGLCELSAEFRNTSLIEVIRVHGIISNQRYEISGAFAVSHASGQDLCLSYGFDRFPYLKVNEFKFDLRQHHHLAVNFIRGLAQTIYLINAESTESLASTPYEPWWESHRPHATLNFDPAENVCSLKIADCESMYPSYQWRFPSDAAIAFYRLLNSLPESGYEGTDVIMSDAWPFWTATATATQRATIRVLLTNTQNAAQYRGPELNLGYVWVATAVLSGFVRQHLGKPEAPELIPYERFVGPDSVLANVKEASTKIVETKTETIAKKFDAKFDAKSDKSDTKIDIKNCTKGSDVKSRINVDAEAEKPSKGVLCPIHGSKAQLPCDYCSIFRVILREIETKTDYPAIPSYAVVISAKLCYGEKVHQLCWSDGIRMPHRMNETCIRNSRGLYVFCENVLETCFACRSLLIERITSDRKQIPK